MHRFSYDDVTFHEYYLEGSRSITLRSLIGKYHALTVQREHKEAAAPGSSIQLSIIV